MPSPTYGSLSQIHVHTEYMCFMFQKPLGDDNLCGVVLLPNHGLHCIRLLIGTKIEHISLRGYSNMISHLVRVGGSEIPQKSVRICDKKMVKM